MALKSLVTCTWTLLLMAATMLHAQTGTQRIQFRDELTGFNVTGSVGFAAEPSSLADLANVRLIEKPTDGDGKLTLQLRPGVYLFEATAPGYDSMKSYFHVDAGADRLITVMMDPLEPSKELRKQRVEELLRDHQDTDLIEGHVVDSVTHKPVAGAAITFRNSGGSVETNERGYFEAVIPSAPPPVAVRDEDLPDKETLIVRAKGYKTYTLEFLKSPGGFDASVIEMELGTGLTEHPYIMGYGTPAEPTETEVLPVDEVLMKWLTVPGTATRSK